MAHPWLWTVLAARHAKPNLSSVVAGGLSTADEEQMINWCQSVLSMQQERAARGNAAVIVDPVGCKAVGYGVDNREGHPLQHAVMLALADAAAHNLQQWPPHCHVKRGQQSVDASAEPASKAHCVDSDHGQRPAHSGQCGALSPLSTDRGSGDLVHTKAISTAADNSRPYLCTGYDCYLVVEPCAMCAMALTHSRVRRVVYAQADPMWGALGSCMRLHSLNGINHRLSVYHVKVLAR
jgi:tRNA-specific adenosine deaminase 3